MAVALLIGPSSNTAAAVLALTANVAILQSNVSTLQGNVSTLTSDLGNVVANVSTLQGNVSTLVTFANVTLPMYANSAGISGQTITDGTWIYVCVSNGVWVRSPAATW